jgi:hypothetical protein
MALFADDLWGQVGNGRSHTMGIRFDTTLSFFTALSIGAAPFARDLVLQYVSAANGYSRAPGPAHALGSIVGCNLGQIAGRYHGDVGDCIEVSLAKDLLECKISRKNEFVANVPMRVAEDGLLIGDGRWDAFQFEFFPHPETGEACLMLGQIAYKKF